jgi:hypothetical protein
MFAWIPDSCQEFGFGISFVSFIIYTFTMTLFYIFIMFLVIMFIVYFDYMLSVVRVIVIFMHMFIKRSSLSSNGVSGRHCVSVVFIPCLPANAPYIPDRVVDREGDNPIESSVIHLPSVGLVGPSCDGSNQALFLLFISKSISNSLANFVSQILLFANSQNNLRRKKYIISNSLANFVSKNLKTR